MTTSQGSSTPSQEQNSNYKYIYGIRPVLEAIEADKSIEKIYVRKGLQRSTIKKIHHTIQQRPIDVQHVPKKKMNDLVSGNHQGVIARIAPVEFQPLKNILLQTFEKGETPLFLISDKITDVRNLGAMARTAECLGVHALILPAKGGAPINQDAIKVSTGAFYRLPVCRERNYTKTLKYLSQSGVRTIAATNEVQEPISKTNLTEPTALIMGSEDRGIPPEHLEEVDQIARIPLTGQTNSLNVNAATAILLYEVQRQRGDQT